MFNPFAYETGRTTPTPTARIRRTLTGRLIRPIQAAQVIPPPPSQTSQAQAGQVPPSQPTQAGSRQSLVDNTARPPSTAELSMRYRSTAALSTPGGERKDVERAPYVPLWDRVCDSLRAARSEEVSFELKFRIFHATLLIFMLGHAVGKDRRIVLNLLLRSSQCRTDDLSPMRRKSALQIYRSSSLFLFKTLRISNLLVFSTAQDEENTDTAPA